MQIVGFSTAQIATWLYIPQYRLLLDAGDGAAAHIGSACEEIDTIAVTHQHRDHVAGLLEVLSWAAYDRPCRVLYPADSPHVDAMRDAAAVQGVPCAAGAEWITVTPGQRIPLTSPQAGPELLVLPSAHVVQKKTGRAVGYALLEAGTVMLAATGDSPATPVPLPSPSNILFCDCTYLRREDALEPYAGLTQHGALDDILAAAAPNPPRHLALYHLNARYSKPDHADLVRAVCRSHGVTYPVSVLWPGSVSRNVLEPL